MRQVNWGRLAVWAFALWFCVVWWWGFVAMTLWLVS